MNGRKTIGTRKGTRTKSECNPFVAVFSFLILSIILLLVVIALSLHGKESKAAATAASNMLEVIKEDLSNPFETFDSLMHYRNSEVERAATGLTERPADPIVVGYAISLVKCGDFQSSRAGLVDAAIVLRHSVHKTSSRNPKSGSKYDYKMFAIVHSQAHAEGCSQPLKDAGFELIVKDAPVKRKEIQGDFLRNHIKKEWCCGEDEFIKLYAYQIEGVPLVVHVDMDYAFVKPMDDVFDAMLFDKDSGIGHEARKKVPVEFPKTIKWPDRIDAAMTRDWPQVLPGRNAGFQAGFIVVKPDPHVFDIVLDVIRKGDYVEGYGRDNGWGGKGYGAFVGAMAMQGLLAYVYDILLYDTWIELNQCRFNHIGMDVLFRAMPAFRKNHPKVGQCRNDLSYCEDCMHTEVSKIYNVHYNQCRKPWNCIGEGSKSKKFGKESIPEDQVHLDHCMELMTIWHDYRTELEIELSKLTGDSTIGTGRLGKYKKEIFQGHCTENGSKGYLPLAGKTGTFQAISDLYSRK